MSRDDSVQKTVVHNDQLRNSIRDEDTALFCEARKIEDGSVGISRLMRTFLARMWTTTNLRIVEHVVNPRSVSDVAYARVITRRIRIEQCPACQ